MRGIVPTDSIIPLNSNPAMLMLFHQSTILLEELDGHLADFAGYRSHYITYLYVHPEHRRNGVATRLITAVLEVLGGDAQLNVAKSNVGAYAQSNT